MALRLCWHRFLAIDEQMVCDLVGVDQTRMVWRGRVVGWFIDSLPCLATVMTQINRCNDIFISLLLLFFHCVNQLVSSLQGSFGKRVA